MSYMAPDATTYAPGAPAAKGSDAIRAMFAELMKAPGFSVTWTADKADVAASGDVAYTTGTYDLKMAGATEKGKYVTVWKKQADGSWKVAEDIFNADTPPQAPATQHVMLAPSALKWGDSPRAVTGAPPDKGRAATGAGGNVTGNALSPLLNGLTRHGSCVTGQASARPGSRSITRSMLGWSDSSGYGLGSSEPVMSRGSNLGSRPFLRYRS